MLELIQAIPFAFGALFPVVNPIGSSVIFLALVNNTSHKEVNMLALKVSMYAITLLVVVLLIGSGILRLFGITIPIVLIGGGLVLAYIGWQLLNQPDTAPTNDSATTNTNNLDQMAFYPLTMPVTAGPGCIAVAIALGAHSIKPSWEATVLSQLGNVIGISMVGITVYICYRYASTITNKLGPSGSRVIMRLAAFINLCIGLELMWHGVQNLLPSSV